MIFLTGTCRNEIVRKVATLLLALHVALGSPGCGSGSTPPPSPPTPGRSDLISLTLKSTAPLPWLDPTKPVDLRSLTTTVERPRQVRPDVGSDSKEEQIAARIVDTVRRLLKAGETRSLARDLYFTPLRPRLGPVIKLPGVTVRESEKRRPAEKEQGVEKWIDSRENLLSLFGGGRFELDIQVQSAELRRLFETTLVLQIRGTDPEGALLQIDCKWHCLWSEHDSSPSLESLHTLSYTEAHSTRKAKRLFADVTASVFKGDSSYREQQRLGIDHWAQRITRLGDLAITGHHGLAVGDVNGDGRDDLYVCDGGSLPNRLYVQQADGTVLETSKKAGVDWLEDSRAALLVDLDNDGDQDLIVSTIAMIAFAENDGSGKFSLRGGFPGAPNSFSLSAADHDNDGDLDLYACVYTENHRSSKRGFEARTPQPFNDARNGGRNVLLSNEGAFHFVDATKRTGLDSVNSGWSFAASWEDFDRDGDMDLYVANDFGRNSLYRNHLIPDGTVEFSEVAKKFGVQNQAAGMSVSWGDLDRDGSMDLYVGNMHSNAGLRVSKQLDSFRFYEMAVGNSLFTEIGVQDGGPQASDARVDNGHWAWSSAFVDLNNDGWEDIVVANGYISSALEDDL
ncbi:MAG: VCBS repeat-containing protein [Planctomycetota bacterium]